MKPWLLSVFAVSIALSQAGPSIPAPFLYGIYSGLPQRTPTLANKAGQTSDVKSSSTSAQTPPVTPTHTQVSAPATTNAMSYIVSPGDSLEITVWNEPSLSGKLPVRPDGMISLSLIGDLRAAGFSPMELSQNIATELKKFINNPIVNVTVLAVHPKQIYLLGEVARIGALTITPDMTPLQAIAAAGGLTPYAKAKHIYILRGEKGKQKKILFDYKKAIKDGNQQGVVLLPDDTIVVP